MPFELERMHSFGYHGRPDVGVAETQALPPTTPRHLNESAWRTYPHWRLYQANADNQISEKTATASREILLKIP